MAYRCSSELQWAKETHVLGGRDSGLTRGGLGVEGRVVLGQFCR